MWNISFLFFFPWKSSSDTSAETVTRQQPHVFNLSQSPQQPMYYQYYRRQTPEEDYLSTQQAKSLYRSRVGSQFCGINLWDFISKIWAGFGSVGNDEKIILGRLWETFEGDFFMLSWKKKYCSIRTKKLHYIYIYICIFLAQNRLNIHNQLWLLYWRHLSARLST